MDIRSLVLLPWLLFLVPLLRCAKSLDCDNSTQYGYPYPENKRCCTKCDAGEYMTYKCTYLEDTRCARCPEGSYNPVKNKKQNCERCRICEGGFFYEKQCTRYSNAVCKCNSGLQCMDEECSRCIYPAVITPPAEISVRVKQSTPAKEPAAKPATPAKEPAVKQSTPAKEPAAKPAIPAKEPAAKPATPAKEPAGRIFLISCLIPAFVLLTVIICVYLLHRTWQPKKEKMSTGTSQDESLFNDESETISECRRSEEEEGPVPVQEESCKETFRCV
ncbi:CD27 antigen [Acipenser oxyrinchus oxyrinchus]|uniref:CD27 antigen n=1 Tax=Acipenser oxyrinchus oxyrinchus TaxID=40147 RepID=A0AAD8G0N8_ACIOX|nr:CD27 antigen [Acipenser oxyrinchus oxyrinchus]